MIEKGDLIKIEYSGYDEKGNLFDTTYGEIAKKLHGKEGAILLIYGYDTIIKGLEEAILLMKVGEERTVKVPPEKAFGFRDKKKIKIFSISHFYNNNINPVPGIVVELETEFGVLNGIVKSVSGGRVTVDFNHPLADQTLTYHLKLVEIIKEKEEKIKAIMSDLNVNGTYSFDNDKLLIFISDDKNLTEEIKLRLYLALKMCLSDIKEIEISVKK